MYSAMSRPQAHRRVERPRRGLGDRRDLRERWERRRGLRDVEPVERHGKVDGNATLALPGQFETVQQLAGAYSQILQYGLPEDYFDTFTQKATSLTADGANATAKKFIQPEHLVWVVVGDGAYQGSTGYGIFLSRELNQYLV